MMNERFVTVNMGPTREAYFASRLIQGNDGNILVQRRPQQLTFVLPPHDNKSHTTPVPRTEPRHLSPLPSPLGRQLNSELLYCLGRH
mmetsp:Transcript_52884/g.105082  ORF Transcript_52884/g.105082 Transcript_52884/m.105082 type:complete len:87 (+) Transcript_52884:20-280(+)